MKTENLFQNGHLLNVKDAQLHCSSTCVHAITHPRAPRPNQKKKTGKRGVGGGEVRKCEKRPYRRKRVRIEENKKRQKHEDRKRTEKNVEKMKKKKKSCTIKYKYARDAMSFIASSESPEDKGAG